MKGFSLLETNIAILLLSIFILGNTTGLTKLFLHAKKQNAFWEINAGYLTYQETGICPEKFQCSIKHKKIKICLKDYRQCRKY